MQSIVIPFAKDINPATRDDQVRRVPFQGRIRGVDILFPPGPSNLVEVRLMLSSGGVYDPVFPGVDDTFIALDDITIDDENLDVSVKPGDELRVEWWNHDGGFAHNVPVLVTLEKAG